MKFTDAALVLLFPVILFSILVYYNYSIIKTWKNQNSLSQHGVSIRANVIDKTNFKSTKGGSTWTIKYTYEVDNQTYSTSKNVPQDFYNRTAIAQSIDVVYDSSSPTNSNIPNNYATSNAIWGILCLDAIILGTLIWGYFKYK